VGNGAWNQFQLDVYGELMEALWAVRRITGGVAPVREVGVRFVSGVVERAIACFDDPDEGIWEVRGGRQHFVFSKLMAWVAVDRGVRLARDAGVTDVDLDRWRQERDRMRERIERDGVDPETSVFTQAFGSPDLDAATLQVPLRGFLATDDPRVVATIDAIDRTLTTNAHVYRYRSHDGLAGDEGAFVFCTAWLINCLALSGRVDEAKERLGLLLASANDLGLLAEEIDPATGRQLGNFPQAFSHVGVIAATRNIMLGEQGVRKPLSLL
jgi:GH15 family glucan-1,4-alpha-glucosidase